MSRTRHNLLPKLAAALATAMLAACATHKDVTEINLVALNDFHGNLESSTYHYTSAKDHVEHTVKAGGVDTLAAAVQAWRKEDDQLLIVGAGDLVGAAPPMSSMWADEPSIEALSRLGLRVSSVGNHEFDLGRVELLRQQYGGCASLRQDKACKLDPKFGGARFDYLAANVIDQASGKPILPAYRVLEAHGVKIAFIGVVLKDTPSMVSPGGVAGLAFGDEADAVNRQLPDLRAQGVHAFVVLIHQGGHTDEGPDQADCSRLQGPIVDVVKKLDPSIRLVVSGHTHTGYTCKVDGRVVTQADMGGHLLTRIRLDMDRINDTVLDVHAANEVMLPGSYPADPAMLAYLQLVKSRSEAELARPVARIGALVIKRAANSAGESAFGDLVADSMLAGTRRFGAEIAFINNGGLRKDLEARPDLVVDEAAVRATLPFGNTLIVTGLSGVQLKGLLEEQGTGAAHGGPLQVSQGLSYRWNQQPPVGSRVSDLRLNGMPVEDGRVYRVTINNFLAQGGDHFSMFTKGSDTVDSGVVDVDALRTYLAESDAKGHPAGKAGAEVRIIERK